MYARSGPIAGKEKALTSQILLNSSFFGKTSDALLTKAIDTQSERPLGLEHQL